ncbi:NAD(P)-binding protein [Coniophora puteana RWD-64-598 SS2]|uniref:NAD(P)-binding protein n=1 Tax=Coniophora puteana (strain RWD-64-598) TaxID=741705 RepID=A0A5M3MQZ3_CONPW|nr:NAD(P)-binding protein [Coniophora puteana RWD-64-598 SS2]EIW81579.1 NAD(P)-binding protein [Coniophora puteana RWD-64-598 SS2]
MPTWFITGASRGIGLELTRQLLQLPDNTVFATCRDPARATDLRALAESYQGAIHIIQLDVAEEESIAKGAGEVIQLLDGRGLDYLFNNAAINHRDSAFAFSSNDLRDTFTSNVIGPALVSQYLLQAIERSERKVIVNMTSTLSSFAKDCGAKSASYSISKTAVNMLTYKQAKERPDLIPIVLDPGWVKTEMGGQGALIEAEKSVRGILKVVTGLTTQSAGKFLNYQGKEIPW